MKLLHLPGSITSSPWALTFFPTASDHFLIVEAGRILELVWGQDFLSRNGFGLSAGLSEALTTYGKGGAQMSRLQPSNYLEDQV